MRYLKTNGSGRVGSRDFETSRVGSSRVKRFGNLAGRVGSDQEGFWNLTGRRGSCPAKYGPRHGSDHCDPRVVFFWPADRTGISEPQIHHLILYTHYFLPEGLSGAGAPFWSYSCVKRRPLNVYIPMSTSIHIYIPMSTSIHIYYGTQVL